MDLRKILDKLKKNRDFRKWKDKTDDAFFSYAFKIPQEMGPEEWQMGFYSRRRDKITTFVMKGESIEIKPEEEVFKQEGIKVYEIELDKINLSLEDAIKKADEFQKKNFPKDASVKTIAILQNMPETGNIWNITYLTGSFNTLNMKISASSGKMVYHSLASVFSFGKQN